MQKSNPKNNQNSVVFWFIFIAATIIVTVIMFYYYQNTIKAIEEAEAGSTTEIQCQFHR